MDIDAAERKEIQDHLRKNQPIRGNDHRVCVLTAQEPNGFRGLQRCRLSDREPELLRRLARELSDRMGAFVLAIGAEEGTVVRYVALERGRVVDEYLSVPEFYGPLPPGEVIALGANPRLMARLTGADAEAVRATARTALSPAELPPARELLAAIAALFGIPGATHGYEEARSAPGATDLPR